MIADEDFESIMETLDVLADAAAMRDIAQSEADAAAGRYFTAPELEMILAARAEGIDLETMRTWWQTCTHAACRTPSAWRHCRP